MCVCVDVCLGVCMSVHMCTRVFSTGVLESQLTVNTNVFCCATACQLSVVWTIQMR